MIEHVKEVTKDIKSFSIRLNGLVKTDDDCLFLMTGEGVEKIVFLHDRLYSGILASFIAIDYPFTPHVTLGDFPKTYNNDLT